MHIEHLRGTLLRVLANGAIIDVHNIGYGLELPLSLIGQLPEVGQAVSFWTYTYVKEDALRLFGFRSFEERTAFEILLSLNGVGPKLALAILSSLSLGELRKVVEGANTTALERIPGVGPRMAEKLLVELKPKVIRLPIEPGNSQVASASLQTDLVIEGSEGWLFEDLKSALENLGFKERAINPLMTKLRSQGVSSSFPALMKRALVELSGTRGADA